MRLRYTNFVLAGKSTRFPVTFSPKTDFMLKRLSAYKLKRTGSTLLYYPSTRSYILAGAKSFADSYDELFWYFGGSDGIVNVRVTNICTVYDCRRPLDLEDCYTRLANSLLSSERCTYEPERFNAITFFPNRLTSEALNIFRSGKIIACGFKQEEQLAVIVRAFDKRL